MNSEFDIKMAGHGGQGIMVMGKILAEAGLKEGKEVVFFPSYGGEMRGGAANCTLIISSKKIASPYRSHPKALVAMNMPSLDRFQKELLPQSILIYNTSLIKKAEIKEDLIAYPLPITELAEQANNIRSANIVALSFIVLITGVVSIKVIREVVAKFFSGRKQAARKINLLAIDKACEYWMNYSQEGK